FFFFFQAEDGIRDLYVTGVQTCALPIFLGVALEHRGERAAREQAEVVTVDRAADLVEGSGQHDRVVRRERRCVREGPSTCVPERSEERRVGKECRSGGAAGGGKEDRSEG